MPTDPQIVDTPFGKLFIDLRGHDPRELLSPDGERFESWGAVIQEVTEDPDTGELHWMTLADLDRAIDAVEVDGAN